MKVKVCGITNHDDAARAAYYGASALGFIFHKKSPRYISPSKAKKIIAELPPFVVPVGIFVNLNEKAIVDICRFTKINTTQLHGDESAALCKRVSKNYKVIKAFRVDEGFDLRAVEKYDVSAYLFDTYKENVEGGTGEAFNWDIIKDVKFDKPVILSGGLKASNIQAAMGDVKPYAVDISSGLEKKPGIKDPRKIREFFDLIDFSYKN